MCISDKHITGCLSYYMKRIIREKHKTKKLGAPRIVTSPIVDKKNPDNYPTLVRYLEANGKLKHTTYAIMMKARNLYFKGAPSEKIAMELRIEPMIVDRWALCFSWDEERDRRLFEQFRKINGVEQMYGQDVSKRHDRIAGTIEQIAERRLQQSIDNPLSVKDLKGITDVIKSTQEIRRTVRGEKAASNPNNPVTNNTLIVNVPGNLEKVSNALMDVFDRPKLAQAKTKTIAVGVEDAIGHDTEYETANRNAEAGE